MNLNEVYHELEELQMKYMKTINILSALEKKVAKLEKENERLQKQNNILRRAIEIALSIDDCQSQTRHLKAVLGKLHEVSSR